VLISHRFRFSFFFCAIPIGEMRPPALFEKTNPRHPFYGQTYTLNVIRYGQGCHTLPLYPSPRSLELRPSLIKKLKPKSSSFSTVSENILTA